MLEDTKSLDGALFMLAMALTLLILLLSGLGIATLAIGMVVRLIVSFFTVWGTNLNMKERLFIPFAWLPKATVQVIFYVQKLKFE